MNPLIQENLSIKSDFALFNNIKSVEAKQARKSLRSITKQLSTPIESSQKDTYLVGPYKLGSEGKRANHNIETVSALVFDIDDPKGYTFDDIIALTSDYFGVLHTTWSHTKDAPRYRLVIHLKEEIAACDFSEVRDNFLFFNPELASIVDTACKDISRAYYWFSYPPERSENAQCCVLMGNPINPRQFKLPVKRGQGLNLLGAYNSQLAPIMQGGIIEGSRNKNLASLIGSLIKKGASRHETYSTVMEWNISLKPPLPIAEVERTHNSIWKTHLSKNPDNLIQDNVRLYQPSKVFDLIPAGSLLATLPPRREWVIENFLPSKIVAAIIAAGGTGKSYLAMHIAVSVASGTLLFESSLPKNAAQVVFISGEDDAPELQRRLHKAVAGLSPKEVALVNQNLHFIDLADSFELFTERTNKGEVDITQVPRMICDQIIKEVGPNIGLVIVDPVARFRGGEENLAADATRFVQALQQIRDQLNTCVLALHHVNKGAGTGGNQNNARGSSAFIDGVRLVFQLNALLEPEIRQSYGNPLGLPQLLTLQSVKSNYGKPAEPMVLARRDDGSLELFDVAAKDHQQNDLLKEIEGCNLSKTQFKELYGGVKKKFGLAEKALMKRLEQLNQEGFITIPNRGAMTVTESGKKLTNS
jgi:hypothetical protein